MRFFTILILLACTAVLSAQNDENVNYVTYPSGFYEQEILRDVYPNRHAKAAQDRPPELKVDFTNAKLPTEIADYTVAYHSVPVSQGNSGTCWCYAATSFLESEVFRLQNKKIDLSEMFVVYCEYVDKAAYFVDNQGDTFVGEGSESNAVLRVMKTHGLLPLEAYTGLPQDHKYNNHNEMFDEYHNYLLSVKTDARWDKDSVIAGVKAILNKYMGEPPTTFTFEGNQYTPQSFLDSCLKLNPNHYFSFMSTLQYPYNQKHELVENDNWWHCHDYYNVSLDDFMNIVKTAVSNGFTLSLCGDVSEPGYDKMSEVAIVPTFDIPAQNIDARARELRLFNNTTTDDHCIQLVGYQRVGNDFWYLIKDSGSGAFDGPHKGYRFYHQNYIKLKMMNFMVHVDAARPVLDKIIK